MGFFVTSTGLAPLVLMEAGSPQDQAVDPLWGARRSLEADAAAIKRPRLYITSSALHNPAGATLSAQTARVDG